MTEYRELIETTIQKQMSTIGKPVALGQARKIKGLEIDDEGKVKKIEGDGKKLLSELVDQFESMTGPVAIATTVRAIKEKFGDKPDIELPENLSSEF